MFRIWMTTSILALTSAMLPAQSIDDLNLQIHGYATQGFVYTTQNNWNTTNSSEGSAGWTEAVVNLTARPQPRLTMGVQARYFLLGTLGNDITLDWAQGDYKFNDFIGIRAGKVKTPIGLLNETQDIDPAHLWILLPQSNYPLVSRDSVLAHFGANVYGAIPLGEAAGKLEYRAYAGDRVVGAEDAYLQPFRDQGLTLPGGLSGATYGGSLRWVSTAHGILLGATEGAENPAGQINVGPLQGTLSAPGVQVPSYFGRLERRKFLLAAEYNRIAGRSIVQFPGLPTSISYIDRRGFYVMTSYKLAGKLTAGAYYASSIDRKAAFTSSRYQKDWTFSTRYDVNPFLYLKAEQHLVDGTLVGFDSANNTALKPTTNMTFLKVGVSF